MKYKNIKTGAVIDTASEVHGEDWQAVMPAGAPEKRTTKPTQSKRKGSANDRLCNG